jgi:Ribbon-helix-helix protein, copG family
VKRQISVHLELGLLDQVEKLAARENRSKSLVIERAVALFLSPDSADRREAPIVRRLDLLTRQYERMHRDLVIFAEYFDNVVPLWIVTQLPILAKPDKAARAKSYELHAALLRFVARRIARGCNVVLEISEDIDAQQRDTTDDARSI